MVLNESPIRVSRNQSGLRQQNQEAERASVSLRDVRRFSAHSIHQRDLNFDVSGNPILNDASPEDIVRASPRFPRIIQSDGE